MEKSATGHRHEAPRRLLFINHSLGMGGIETLLLEICRSLVKAGSILPGICVFETSGRLESEISELGVAVHVLPKRGSLDFFLPFRIRDLIQSENYELVHVHNQSAWLYGGIGAILAKRPLIYTEHTGLDKFPPGQRSRWRILTRLLGKRTKMVTTVARHLIPDLTDKAAIPVERIRNIYNGIDLGPYQHPIDREKKCAELGLSVECELVGIVASLTDAKDHATLLQAFVTVVRSRPKAMLLIVGEGPLKDGLIKQVEESGLQRSVKFLGVRRDIPELLQLFDIFVLSSLIEGLPISLLEAMASSCAVVATRIPGIDELVDPPHTGLLVPHSQPEPLAEAIIEVLADQPRRQAMGVQGRERIVAHFSFAAMVGQYLALYREVIEPLAEDSV